ncbi:MAG: tRNA pseudouridine(55) synthase TruB, partial [Candidatus Rokuibacteriota bacterium]
AASAPASGARWVAVLSDDDTLLGVGEVAAGRVQPARILHADHPGPRVLPV